MYLPDQHPRLVVSAVRFYHGHKLARLDLVTDTGGGWEGAVCSGTSPEDVLFGKFSGQVESSLFLFVGGTFVVRTLGL